MSKSYDVCVIGGGIVGLATALQVLEQSPRQRVLLLEKETRVAAHQTGHNSGVIHAGIYYKPNSLKAHLCKAGEAATKQFCTRNNIAYRTPGKLVVATDEDELARMHDLEINARGNGIEIEHIDARQLRSLEPNIAGLGALKVPSTGIVDYSQIARVMAELIREAGGEIILDTCVDRIEESDLDVLVIADGHRFPARKVIVCAGLQTDRLARRSGIDIDFRIVPFRGEYYVLHPERANVVDHLIYPVPDPTLPFLGIHLTPMIDGSTTVGPNAVLGLSREGYGRFAISGADMASYLSYPGFWKVIGKNWKAGLSEAQDSVSRKSYLRKCQKYCPSLRLNDLGTFRTGIRAQAISKAGELIHDFHFVNSERVLYVGNAPSPAATSAIPIARTILERFHRS